MSYYRLYLPVGYLVVLQLQRPQVELFSCAAANERNHDNVRSNVPSVQDVFEFLTHQLDLDVSSAC